MERLLALALVVALALAHAAPAVAAYLGPILPLVGGGTGSASGDFVTLGTAQGITPGTTTFSSAARFDGGLRIGPTGTAFTQVDNVDVSLTPAEVDAATSEDEAYTVTGVAAGDYLTLALTVSPTTGVVPVAVRATNTNEATVTWLNVTAGPLTPAAGTYGFLIWR